MSRPNGITDQFSFDADGRLVARDAIEASGTVVNRADYTYSPAGSRDSLTDLTGVHDYTYDTDGRLTGVDHPDGGLADETYSYDSLGNLASWPQKPEAQVQHNTADQLTRDATNSYAYDREGNLTQTSDRSTGKSRKYLWNAAHQLTRVTEPDGISVDYGYGPLGRRLTTTDAGGTQAYVWAGGNLRATLDATGTIINRNITTAQLNGTLAVTTPTGTTYPLQDGLGSTTATTNPTAGITSTTTYTAYGIPTTTGNDNTVNTLAGYTGHQTDPTGLNYARNRYYNPTTGTFLTQDPIIANNLYTYTAGDPIGNTDPTGALIAGEIQVEIRNSSAIGGVLGAAEGVARCASRSDPRDRIDCVLGYAITGAVAGAWGGTASGSLAAGMKGAPLTFGESLGFSCWFGAIGGALFEGQIFDRIVEGRPSSA